MSSSEPPSRIPPRNQTPDTKSARDELSSKGKVEKVREVDSDETRKRKFLKFYEDKVEPEEEAKPSPYELISSKESTTTRAPFSDAEDAIVPSPAYSPPPNVNVNPTPHQDDEATTGALPQSETFWEDLPSDEPQKPKVLKETKGKEKPEEKKEPSPFGPPGKIGAKGEKKAPTPFEKEAAPPKVRPAQKAEEREISGERVIKKERAKQQVEETVYRDLDAGPYKQEQRDSGQGKQGREQKVTLESAFPSMPAQVHPMAAAATAQAAPYIHPSTMTLFYQMVGTIYIMAGPQGVNRTEIVLNSPTFADSKFYGATIRIEKYATAPDSFNITLSGSDRAVVSFKENIPSLMAAFENGNFTFKVNRLDVEHTIDRPVFRRKERGEGRGDADGGDLGERRK